MPDPMTTYDLAIIGGGINGCGIASDAAGRGLKVYLCEQDDLASATSSWSSKLIHGGLRYLEYYEFRLVREALKERQVLLRKSPNLIHPLRFIMPHDKSLRPAWMIQIGLLLYDHLGGKQKLEKSKKLNLRLHPTGKPLKGNYHKGFIYSDCQVDDARLVIANAMDAKNRGAMIQTRQRCIEAQRFKDNWRLTLQSAQGETSQITAKVLVNAAGPWVDDIIHQVAKVHSQSHISLVKGSHIVVPKIYTGHQAYILQNVDKRIVFVIPYLEKYSLIGTTDVAYEGDPKNASISNEEIQYLIDIVDRYFNHQIDQDKIVWQFSGVRPLHADAADNPSAMTRDYTLELNIDDDLAPILSIFGGKITTYRKLSEHALEKLATFFPQASPAWTADATLPGGDMEDANFPKYYQHFQHDYPWLPNDMSLRIAKNYGTLSRLWLKDCHSMADLGEHFAHGLTAGEVDYLLAHEWAMTVDDIIWRRTKTGIEMPSEAKARIAAYLSGAAK